MLSKVDITKLPQGTLFKALRAAAAVGESLQATKIYRLIKVRTPEIRALHIRAYAVAGNFEQANKLFEKLPKTRQDYLQMTSTMHIVKRPIEERMEFLRLMREKGLYSYKVYLDALNEYYKDPNAGKDSKFLKEMLSEMSELKLIEKLKPMHIGNILKLCVMTKDKELFTDYFHKLTKMDPNGPDVREWIQFK
jgi:hypothetical protein